MQRFVWVLLDYITKPIYKAELEATVKRCLSPTLECEVPVLHFTASTETEYIDDLENDLSFLAACPVMKQLRAQCSVVAKVDVPILLLGESGVGKEIVARLIHKLSPRANKPFLKVNCAALPANFWKANYSVTRPVRLPEQSEGNPENSNKPTMALSCWTNLAR